MKATKIRQRASGIYVISNEITGAKYYGSAWRVGVRRQRHFRDLELDQHTNAHLQAAWKKYGRGAFTFRVLAYLEKGQLLPTEQKLLNAHYGHEDCYNVSPVAGAPMAGRKHTPETIELVRAKVTGLKRSDESLARYAAASRLRGFSDLARERSTAAKLGKKQSPEHIERKAAAIRGRKHSPERIAQRMAKRRGMKESPEIVEAKRQRVKAWAQTPEAKAKMSEAAKKREAAKKASGWKKPKATPEEVEANRQRALAQWAEISPEQRSEMWRARWVKRKAKKAQPLAS